jgi:hypothetical protein
MSFQSDRDFQLWDYNVSHRQMLVRSPAAPGVAGNVDIVFWAVDYIGIPAKLDGLEFMAPSAEELATAERLLGRPPDASTIYVLSSAGRRFLVIAAGYRVLRNDLDIFESTLQTLGPTRVGASGEVLVGS